MDNIREAVIHHIPTGLIYTLFTCQFIIFHFLLCFQKAVRSEFSRYSHSGDVLSWEGIGGVTDEQAGFSHSPESERKKERKKDKEKDGASE